MPDEGEPPVLVEHRHAERTRVVELRTRLGAGDDIVRLLRNRPRDLRAKPLRLRLCFVSRHLRQRACEDDRLACDGRLFQLQALIRLDRHLIEQRMKLLPVVLLAEEIDQRVDDRLTDAFDVVDVSIGVAVLAAF